MARIIWSDPALDDLDDIAEYIALDNAKAAKKLVKNVFSTVDRLSKFPNSGREPPELSGSIYQEVIVPPCRVIYRVTGKTVFIVYVIRSEMKIRKYLIEERDNELYG